LSIQIHSVRIGDRNLLPTIRSEDFLAQLSSYRIKQLIDTDGKKIWSGTLNASPELNVDVTTALTQGNAMEGSKLPTRALKLPFVIDKATARPRFFMRANYDGQIMPTAPVAGSRKIF
jgi:hypothetical protein